MSTAKKPLIILSLVLILMAIQRTLTAQICNEYFSSISCRINMTTPKKCIIKQIGNDKSFEKDIVTFNPQNSSRKISIKIIRDGRRDHTYVTCCLEKKNITDYLCYDNSCQYKIIYILQQNGFHMNDARTNICLSGNQLAIQKALHENQLDKPLMEIGLLTEVSYEHNIISIKQNGTTCPEDLQIMDSDRIKWKSFFHKTITNCSLKTKKRINKDYTLVLKFQKNATYEIWHFLVVKSDISGLTKILKKEYNANKSLNRIFDSKDKLAELIDMAKHLTEIVMENKQKIKIFINLLNNITAIDSISDWTKLNKENKANPTKIMHIVDKFLKNIVDITNTSEHIKVDKENIAFQLNELKNNTISVDFEYPASLKVHIADSITKNMSSDNQVFYSIVYYKSLMSIIQTTETDWKQEIENSRDLLSDILSFTIYKHGIENPIKNITFRLNHKELTLNTECAYWSSNSSELIGQWKTDGCFRTSWNESYTECVCHHLTNFALLMSHHKIVKSFGMDIVSMIGGMISILAVFLTIICYIILWRYVTTTTLNKSRAIILMNLCVSMFIANLLFLLSDYLKKYMIGCKVISTLLHFFYLTVFFCMLAEGIDIFITIVFVFSKINVKKLIFAAWALPAVIVAISTGVTQFDGYGELDHCWLSQKRGLKWAFMGPVFVIIFTNMIIILVVLISMLKNSEMLQKSVAERARAGMWGLILFSPILGFTWCFGIFLLHESVVAQYVFVICHSLQGILIFLLHCIFSKQIKEGFFQYMKKLKNKSSVTNSICKSVAFDKTQSPTLTTIRSVDNLTLPYPQTLGIFQTRKSQDFLVPSKNGAW